MPVYQQGQLNVAALQADDVYIQVIPPQNTTIQGIATNVGGIVGTGAWGPANTPVIIGTTGDAKNWFGPIGLGVNDLPTDLVLAIRQGASNLRGVRVTDGTDAAATITLSDTAAGSIARFIAFYTGKVGNTITVQAAAGSNNQTGSPTWRITINRPGYASEVFDRIVGGAAFQANLVSAINNGQSGIRGPSQLVTASANGAPLAAPAAPVLTTATAGGNIPAGTYYAKCTWTTANGETTASAESASVTTTGALSTIMIAPGALPTGATGVKFYLTPSSAAPGTEVYAGTNAGGSFTATALPAASAAAPPTTNTATVPLTGNNTPSQTLVTLTGGTNGDTTITTSVLLGTDGNIRTGMYALRGTGVQHFMLAGSTDTTGWSTANTFAVSEGCCFWGAFPTGTSTATAIATKQGLGLDDWHYVPLKDFISFFDSENNLVRSVPPTSTALGLACNQSPEQSPGNKPILGILGTERTIAGVPYSNAEIASLSAVGINFITNPIPRGNVFGLRHGLNGSTDPTVNGLNYTKMTNFLALSLNANLGRFVEELQSTSADDPTRKKAANSIRSFLQNLKRPIAPGQLGMIDSYAVTLDSTNNSAATIGQGYMFGYAKVRYLGVVRFFVFSLEGGQTVVTPQALQPAA